VLEPDVGVAQPGVARAGVLVADDAPQVARVALAVLAEAAHLLVLAEGRREQVAVQEAVGGQVVQPHRVVALHRLAVLQETVVLMVAGQNFRGY